MTSLPAILAIAGCIALLAGLFGGGVKAKELEVPKINTLSRILSALIGLGLIVAAAWIYIAPPPQAGSSPTQPQPTQPSPTQPPPTQPPPTQPSPTQPSPTPSRTPLPTLVRFPTLILPIPLATPAGSMSPSIGSFVGTWRNIDANTPSWTKVEITSDGMNLSAHFWGACSPTDCDAGVTSALYNGIPVLMTQGAGFATRTYTFSFSGNKLHISTFTHFTDNSGRADYTSDDYFSK